MELGQKLKQARMEAGLSQRQLCGETITRNMLSQIENGNARPSMDTLRYLASRLEKPVSFFLEEEIPCSPNQTAVMQARAAFDRGDAFSVLEALRDFREPDPVFGTERKLLESLALLEEAQQALKEERKIYALDLLKRAEALESPYTAHLRQKRLLLMARAGGDPEKLCSLLESPDEALLLRARGALSRGSGTRAGELLDAAEDKTAPEWNLLRGDVYGMGRQYAEAARCYHAAEHAYPEHTAPKLEQCYRELGDYKLAYEYACKQKK